MMSLHYERRGPLTELSSYPQWAQDMVDACETTKREVVDHDIWPAMCSLAMTPEQTSTFMVGLWPVIEGFPGYMARSLLKTRYGRSAGDDMARRWLVRNIRVEQKHAEYWLHWAPPELKSSQTGASMSVLMKHSRRGLRQPTTQWKAPQANGPNVYTRAVNTLQASQRNHARRACGGCNNTRLTMTNTRGRHWKLFAHFWVNRPLR